MSEKLKFLKSLKFAIPIPRQTCNADDTQFCITSFLWPVSTHCCEDTREENFRLLLTKLVYGNTLPLSHVEGVAFELLVFAKPKYNQLLWKQVTKVENTYEDRRADSTDSCTALTTES